jgi:hypothetical protein
MKFLCQTFLCLLLLLGCAERGASPPPRPSPSGAMLRAPVTPLLLVTPSSIITAPAPTVLHLAWDYTNQFCSADLQFGVEQSTNLIDWTPAGTSYGLSLSVTGYTDRAFYRVKTLVP